MKISELQALEAEQIEGLRERAAKGDNEAARVLLEHLRKVSKAIEAWVRIKRQQEADS